MNSAVRRGMVVVLLMLSAGCGSTGPVSPTETRQPAALPPPAPPPAKTFPSLSGPSRTFLFRGELSYRVRDYTKQSRFVLYDNGAFVVENFRDDSARVRIARKGQAASELAIIPPHSFRLFRH